MFLLTVAAFGFLSCSPFAYAEFSEPNVSVVHAVDGRDSLFDLGAMFVGDRLEMTQAMITGNRQLIGRQLDALASTYHHSLSR